MQSTCRVVLFFQMILMKGFCCLVSTGNRNEMELRLGQSDEETAGRFTKDPEV